MKRIMETSFLKSLSEVARLRKEYDKYKKELGISYDGNLTKFLDMLFKGKLMLNHKKIKIIEEYEEENKDIKQAKPA